MTLVERYEEFLEMLASNKKIVLFGAGQGGIKFIKEYLLRCEAEELYDQFEYICDNDERKWGSGLFGKEIVPPTKLLEDKCDVVVIVASVYYTEIYTKLKDMGVMNIFKANFFDRISNIASDIFGCKNPVVSLDPIRAIHDHMDKIERVRSFFSDKRSLELYDTYIKRLKYGYHLSDLLDEDVQYFPLDILSFSDDEVFVDAGCYNGATAVDFAKTVNGRFKKIYSFEANPLMFDNCVYTLSHSEYIDGKFEFIPAGVFSHRGNHKLFPCGDGSRIDKDGTLEIKLCKLDDTISERVSYIKMDIEGAELEALKGAENIIRSY